MSAAIPLRVTTLPPFRAATSEVSLLLAPPENPLHDAHLLTHSCLLLAKAEIIPSKLLVLRNGLYFLFIDCQYEFAKHQGTFGGKCCKTPRDF